MGEVSLCCDRAQGGFEEGIYGLGLTLPENSLRSPAEHGAQFWYLIENGHLDFVLKALQWDNLLTFGKNAISEPWLGNVSFCVRMCLNYFDYKVLTAKCMVLPPLKWLCDFRLYHFG